MMIMYIGGFESHGHIFGVLGWIIHFASFCTNIADGVGFSYELDIWDQQTS